MLEVVVGVLLLASYNTLDKDSTKLKLVYRLGYAASKNYHIRNIRATKKFQKPRVIVVAVVRW